MVGKLWWNLVFASLGGLLVFVLSLVENTISTTLIRSSITFALFFLILFLFRWGLGVASVNHYASAPSESVEGSVTNLAGEDSNSDNSASNENEDLFVNQESGDEAQSNHLSEEEAKKTSEMIRSLLDDNENS